MKHDFNFILVLICDYFILLAVEKTFINADFDAALIASIIGCYYFLLCYLKNIKNTIKLYQLLSDFETFGKPPEFETSNTKLNKLSLFHYTYISIAVGGITFSPLLDKIACEREKLEHGWNEICGILGYAWWPFDIVPYLNYYYVYQIFSSYLIYHTSSVVSFSVMETVEHLIIRLRHVKVVFIEALIEEDGQRKLEKFNNAVKYHNTVIE